MSDPIPPKMPEATKSEWALALAKGAASAAPIVGGSLAEFMERVFRPMLTRRTQEWFERIAAAVNELQEERGKPTYEGLLHDERFFSALMHASQAAQRTHQEEKLQMLQNAVLNVALGTDPDDDRQLMFLDAIDSLTPSHIRILTYSDNPELYRSRFPQVWTGTAADALEISLPQFRNQRDLYTLLYTNLFSHGFVKVDASHLAATGPLGVILSPKITHLGKQFLEFITSPT